MAGGNDKYQATRSNGNEASDSSKKTAKVVARGAADYYTKGKGGAIVDMAADTKLGDDILNVLGKAIDQNPLLKKSAEQLDDSGLLDTADTVLSTVEGSQTGVEGGKTDLLSKSVESGIITSGDNETDTNVNLDLDNEKSKMIGGLGSFIPNPLKIKITLIAMGVFYVGILLLGLFSIMFSGTDDSSLDDSNSSVSDIAGSCVYKAKGFSNGSKTVKQDVEIKDLKVRLMECDGSKPVAGEELIDFEKYILGVTYQENGGGSDEAIKTQAVAARSYALSRPAMMGNAGGTKLYKDGEQWILQLRACTNDQAYCDPDKGCWSNNAGGEGSTIHSGQNSSKVWSRGPLAQDSKIRSLVSSTNGQVLVNSNGYILNTSYLNTDQQKWNSSFPGLDYKQILLQYYNNNRKVGASNIVSMSCSSSRVSSGNFVNWKQYDSTWGSINLGNSSNTIRSSGCLVTSIAMLISKSGVPVNVNTFNPGTFVKALNSNNGFDGNGNFYWNTVSKISSNFIYQNKKSVLGLSKVDKLNTLKSLLDDGYYVVAEVKGNTGQHWVAVDNIDNGTIRMLDPASNSNDMWSQYNWANTSNFAYFKVA